MPYDQNGKWYSAVNPGPPPTYPTSAPSGSSGSSEGGYWYTGYGGSKPGWTQDMTFNKVNEGGGGFNLQPGSPGYNATQGAYQRSEDWFLKALARLNQDYMGGTLGNYAQGQFINPNGYDPAVVAAMKRQAGEIIQGSAADAMQSLNAGANASGFGRSMGLLHEQSQARAGRARDVSNAYTQVDINNEQAKLARQQIMQALIGELLRAETGQNQAAAGLMANKTEPVIPGITPGPDGEPGQTWKWLGPDGRQKPGAYPHTQKEWDEFRQERTMWELFYGKAA